MIDARDIIGVRRALDARIEALWKAGNSVTRIAAELHTSSGSVEYRLKKFGLNASNGGYKRAEALARCESLQRRLTHMHELPHLRKGLAQ